ncbi:energy transducer TonB [Undibacterium pigrum]|uniref:Outer membrane transport energization protein TonB n=1 Tax=Undibacterium pigrum TaxID=401470 RepID=A0A318JTP2_9BURK|nr:energy transducer TonB [Undibacterium pigrum]PXX43848.1 outer membrane transport energization protein TonB [Undibacterium pigrum]
MSTLTLHQAPPEFTAPKSRFFSFAAIVLAHLALFYALQHGLLTHAVQILPKEVLMTFVEPPQVKPEPPPKPVPTKKLTSLQTPVVPHIKPVVEIPADTHQITTQAAPPEPQQIPMVAKAEQVSNTPVVPAPPKQISAVEYVRPPQADYPSMSKRMGEEGKVTLRVLVNEKGVAEKVDIQKSSGSNRLDEAAKLAILRALFKPYLEDGKALTVIATATISFSLSS